MRETKLLRIKLAKNRSLPHLINDSPNSKAIFPKFLLNLTLF